MIGGPPPFLQPQHELMGPSRAHGGKTVKHRGPEPTGGALGGLRRPARRVTGVGHLRPCR
eukprot:CAMPEP_0204260642 /NCGR_PEP_ID=MMETSP0468-20130131/6483_1 /ASSEMBLY_ACC=CAM_ASM_000383 /TAXON_ID=2969 /ORGANISM="Oxyrrhis marina" /LENGTH=59 /DNA_ID=CAMNT_0051235103 /DNA_START=317 /DNA_END=492 /DNA_ORIENTATION=+